MSPSNVYSLVCTLLLITWCRSNTLVGIGQNYEGEYQSYVASMPGTPPNGSSFYSTFATNQFQGDGLGFVSYVNTNFPGTYAELGLSLKESGNCAYIYNYLQDITQSKYDNQIDQLSAVCSI